ncbi:hypothetical protein [Aquisphaera insulae]|uniref:hypothetical protein n=1 Tax=Aquisphaera insulae TaxID=2712864 RepID=UPI0013ED2139|nr:hypothetical protein [Aquisphaera insulae]
MIGFLRALLRRLRRGTPEPALVVSDAGVTLLDGDRPCDRFAWSEVREIATFKRDFGTWDDIRLAFRLDDGWVEVSEESEGWSSLTSALESHFPTIPPDWYRAVMLPPFETCYRVLYRGD